MLPPLTKKHIKAKFWIELVPFLLHGINYKMNSTNTTCKFCFSSINPQLNLLRYNCTCGESLVKEIMTQICS